MARRKGDGERAHLRVPGSHYLCRVCRVRLAQHGCEGRCVGCKKSNRGGIGGIRTPILVPAERLAPRPPVPVVYEGVEFLVMWNGR
jgi:hypothetical protein